MNSATLLTLPANSENDHFQYFFGYFDKSPWSISGDYILAHRIDFESHMPTPDDAITIGKINVRDRKGGSFEPITKTKAWSWQQGAMLQWWPGDAENSIVFNDRRDGKFGGVIRNLQTAKETLLERPVAAVSHDGTKALSLNFSRLADERPGYGYAGIDDEFAKEYASDRDGIHIIDMKTGKAELIVSVAQVAAVGKNETMDDTKHWFNHLLFSPNDKRFIFLHRWRRKDTGGHYTRMFTVNVNGTNMHCLNSHDMTSHFDWRDDKTIVAWARRFGIGDRYFLFTDSSDEVSVIGNEKLTPFGDGHCTYSPDKQWILTDSYPDANCEQRLMLYRPADDHLVALAILKSQKWPDPARCDLHPRWNRDGMKICFDSSCSGKRRIYILPVTHGSI